MSKIFIIGDSIMRGVTFSEKRRRYVISRRAGLEPLSHLGFEVVNKARMGFTLRDGLDRLKEIPASDVDGAVVILGFGGNDCDYDWSCVSEHSTEGFYSAKTPDDEYEMIYSSFIESIREHGAEVAVANLVPIDAPRYFNHITKDKDSERILAWLGDVSMLYRWHEYYNRVTERVANETGCLLLDIRTPFLRSHEFSSLISCDGIHPTEKGYSIIDAVICSSLEAAFCSRGQRNVAV